ncbi:MAG TPA: permease [Ktedonobacterales bacterium]
MSLLPSALPWGGLLAFPVLLALILMLLFSSATLAFYVKQRLSFARLQQVFARQPGLMGNLMAALMGAVTPFCTCTAVPLFLGMLEVEVPLGPAISFLLASPTINLGAVIVLLAVFGWRTALFYGSACLIAAVVVGWLLGRVPRERALRDYLWMIEDEPAPGSARVALRKATLLGRQLLWKLFPWLALATLAGMLIDVLVPTGTVAQISRLGRGLGIPTAALLGSVIYADILLLIPLGYALIHQGASVAVVLTFMLAASGMSFSEVIVLSRILQPRLVVLFVGATLATYMLLGTGFLWLGP